MRWPVLGRRGDAWPGVTIAGIVTLAAAVLADAFGEPPTGGPRLWIGLALGALLLGLGYALRGWEGRRP
jgi:hypothetical protein